MKLNTAWKVNNTEVRGKNLNTYKIIFLFHLESPKVQRISSIHKTCAKLD